MGRDFPRVCGDQPNLEPKRDCQEKFTPHARGSTFHWVNMMALNLIYPACAGITLRYSAPVTAQKDLPHTCGDQPRVTVMVAPFSAFTPHVRGLSYISYRYIHYWQTSPIVRGFSPGGIHDDVAIYISYYICCSLSSLTSPNVILVGMIPNSDLAMATLS